MKGLRLPGGFADHVRPTTDFVREALFNKMQHSIDLDGTEVLDLFSGSGIMALEFFSREALKVVSVDRDTRNIQFQRSLKDKHRLERWEIRKADVFRFLEQDNSSWDLIFADPPYDLAGIQQLPGMLLNRLKPGGWLILEHRPGVNFVPQPAEIRAYGSTACSIFVNS